MISEHLQRLLGAYLSGTATVGETAQVDLLLRTEPDVADALAQLALVDAGLHLASHTHPWPTGQTSSASAPGAAPTQGAASAVSQPRTSHVRPGAPHYQRPPARGRRWLTALVTSAVLATSWLGSLKLIERRKPAPIAAATAIEGAVSLIRSSAATPLAEGAPIYAGDRIETAPGASCAIDFPGEPTQMHLGAASALVFDPPPTRRSIQKALSLPVGELSIEAAPQPKGLPLVLRTPHARLTVLGTRFAVAANPQRTAAIVDSGKVRFEGHGEPLSLDLAPGRLGVVGSDVPIRSYPSAQFPSIRALLDAPDLANTPALRHWWTFDDHPRDSAGEAHLSAANIQYRPGKHGRAALIESTYGLAGPEIDLGSKFEIQAWICLPAEQSHPDRRTIISNSKSGISAAGFRLFVLYDSEGRHHLWFETGNGVEGISVRSLPNVIRIGHWHHIRARIDRSTGTAQLFVDGKHVTHPRFASVRTDFPTRARIRVGSMTLTPYHFNGLIDDLQISSF
jgi:hypothetical protein